MSLLATAMLAPIVLTSSAEARSLCVPVHLHTKEYIEWQFLYLPDLNMKLKVVRNFGSYGRSLLRSKLALTLLSDKVIFHFFSFLVP